MGTFGGESWRRAAADGRIQPGRGPIFTRRVLPALLPVLRCEARAAGVPRRTLDQWESPARGVVLPPTDPGQDTSGPPTRLGPGGWSDRPHPYTRDIVTRLRAHWLLAQDAVAGGWAAAGLHGLPYWADSEPVLLLTGRTRSGRRSLRRPVFRNLPDGLPTVCVDPAFPLLRAVDAGTAAAQCLATVLSGKKYWPVAEVPGLTGREVQAIQLIDAFYQCTELTEQQVLQSARHIVDRRSVQRLLSLADYGAQSPMETVLRLLVRDALPPEHRWTSQVRVATDDGEVLRDGVFAAGTTTPDLACIRLKVALYYDGGHHRDADQTDVDFRLFQRLKDAGWEVVRVDRQLLRERAELRSQIAAAVSRACGDPRAFRMPRTP